VFILQLFKNLQVRGFVNQAAKAVLGRDASSHARLLIFNCLFAKRGSLKECHLVSERVDLVQHLLHFQDLLLLYMNRFQK